MKKKRQEEAEISTAKRGVSNLTRKNEAWKISFAKLETRVERLEGLGFSTLFFKLKAKSESK